MAFCVLLGGDDGSDEDGEEDAAFFLTVVLAFMSLDEVVGLALEAPLSAVFVSFGSDGSIGARYVSKTVLRVCDL